MPPRHSNGHSRTRAFSLVEVALALGIVAFALVGVIGLLPAGLNTFQKAMDTSVGSQILQRVVAEARQASYADLTEPAVNSRKIFDLRFFNETGGQTDKEKATYWVQVVSNAASGIPGTAANPDLARVTIDIVHNPGKRELQPDPSSGGLNPDPKNGIDVLRHSFYVARKQTL